MKLCVPFYDLTSEITWQYFFPTVFVKVVISLLRFKGQNMDLPLSEGWSFKDFCYKPPSIPGQL